MTRKFLLVISLLCLAFLLLFRNSNIFNLENKLSSEDILLSKNFNSFETIKIYENKKTKFLSYAIYDRLTMKEKMSGYQGSCQPFYKEKGFSFLEIPLNKNNKVVCGKFDNRIKDIKINDSYDCTLNKANSFWFIFLNKTDLKKITAHYYNQEKYEITY
ncbi:hypothetical protein ACQRC6_05900 [Peptoniphilus sp. SGI.035]|uniref:hypothetical protein n=1 Tax=unclassified Peptoniphilus TaxID=2637196 RepID=UPI002973244E|nr:hypothetical protein [Peptoniphilus sp.]MDD7352524.1 hypothetical protein [Peptoniphilaceae bacterium]MDY3902122.1 hypothetical protein [Peptoniphilus sp.]